MAEFELKYDAAAVQQTLRAARERRGVKVTAAPVVPHGTRVGKFVAQGEKRQRYHAVKPEN